MFHVEVGHDRLKRFRRVSGPDRHVVEQRAQALAKEWEEEWRHHSDAARAIRKEKVLIIVFFGVWLGVRVIYQPFLWPLAIPAGALTFPIAVLALVRSNLLLLPSTFAPSSSFASEMVTFWPIGFAVFASCAAGEFLSFPEDRLVVGASIGVILILLLAVLCFYPFTRQARWFQRNNWMGALLLSSVSAIGTLAAVAIR